MKLSTAIERMGAWLVAIALAAVATAVVSVCLAVRACNVCEGWQESCTRLQEENERLRQELATCSGRPESLVIQVRDRDRSSRTLAVVNRNYLNVHALEGGELWRGQIGTDRYGHAIFEAPAWSIRAGAILLRNYERLHGIRTVEGIVGRFCKENREEYVRFLCGELGLTKNEEFSISARLPELLRAMVRFESGESIGDELLALVEVR